MASDLFGAARVSTQPPDAKPAGESRPRGAYYTPDMLALAICRSLATLRVHPSSILEPGCGGGAFLRAAISRWPDAHLVGVDLVPACTGPGIVIKGDLFNQRASYDLALGNPDFGIAEEVVRHCLGLLPTDGHLAFLLRITFLASQARVPLYREHPLWAFQPIAGRPSFTDGGSDPSEYGLFVWKKGHAGDGRILPPLEWKR